MTSRVALFIFGQLEQMSSWQPNLLQAAISELSDPLWLNQPQLPIHNSRFSTPDARCSLLDARLSTLHSQLGCSSSTLVARHFSYFYHSCHASLGSNKRQMQTECTRSCCYCCWCCCKCCCALKRALATVRPAQHGQAIALEVHLASSYQRQ